ncbi:MAG: transporter [Proteobacteria bacterium]|nr:transporter [Pseudomonadota bacterium]
MRQTTRLSGLFLAVSSTAVLAYQPLITDDTGTQGQGGNQIEFGINRDRADRAGITTTARVLPFTFTRGVTDALDVFVGVNHTKLSASVPGADVSGNGNPVLGLKWRFYENESSKTSLAIKPQLLLPVSKAKEEAGLGSGHTSYSLTAILNQKTGFGVVHFNLATGRTRYRDASLIPDATLYHASISPVWQLSETWRLALDLGSQSERDARIDTSAEYFEVGAIYSPDKDLDIALGFIRRNDHTSSPDTTTNSVTAGVTWRFR